MQLVPVWCFLSEDSKLKHYHVVSRKKVGKHEKDISKEQA
jgi:hypothetical protein